MLLTCLDAGTAAQLLKAAKPEQVTEIAAEMVHLETVGAGPAGTYQLAEDFVSMLRRPKGAQTTFVAQVLASAVGQNRAEELLGQARRMIAQRDPFRAIRDATPEELVAVLGGEHPQVVALILTELPLAKSAALLLLLSEQLRGEVTLRMASGENPSPETRSRVAAVVRSRLESLHKKAAGAAHIGEPAPKPAAPGKTAINPRLRQVALLLRSLATDLRDSLLQTITAHNAETGAAVQNLMVIWEDVALVGDRSMQDVLRNIEARAMALALVGAAPTVAAKVRANVSERARAMIEEETQLMKKPTAEEIDQARETILEYLRQLNASGELQFEEAKPS
jgi:flagellar motor switch protein FliG